MSMKWNFSPRCRLTLMFHFGCHATRLFVSFPPFLLSLFLLVLYHRFSCQVLDRISCSSFGLENVLKRKRRMVKFCNREDVEQFWNQAESQQLHFQPVLWSTDTVLNRRDDYAKLSLQKA
uniref:Uncharacterized protein n=1 Tax=Physcomitrium patens TaxID=3218 RepID=A0A2K1IBS6_PHYPA|nr:hypothetical protein PHYPA_030221 [Physcomitrium patens]